MNQETYEDRCVMDAIRIEYFELPADYVFQSDDVEVINVFEFDVTKPDTEDEE